MPRIRTKEYKSGDKVQVYLSNSVPDEFIEWLNNQSDVSGFFLYAANQLYKELGDIDVSEVMPRKLSFNREIDPIIEKKKAQNLNEVMNRSSVENEKETEPDEEIKEVENEIKLEHTSWDGTDELDGDPYS